MIAVIAELGDKDNTHVITPPFICKENAILITNIIVSEEKKTPRVPASRYTTLSSSKDSQRQPLHT